MIGVLLLVLFVVGLLGGLWLWRRRARNVRVEPLVQRVRSTSPYRVPARRAPGRGF